MQTASFGPIKLDRTPPSCGASVSPSLLFPVNGSLVPVSAKVTTSDALSGPPTWVMQRVTSSEAGTLVGDIQGFTLNNALSSGQSTSGQLAATSLTSSGRIYTLTFQATDGAGNTSSCSATVSVPAAGSGGTVGAVSIGTVVAGSPYAGQLAVFADPGCQSGDVYSASISWGDGLTGTGVVSCP